MIQLKFSEDNIKILQYERYHHPHPHVMRKMEVLHLKSLGLPHDLICRIAGVTKKTAELFAKIGIDYIK